MLADLRVHRHRRRALARHRARGAAGAVRQPAPRRGGLAGRAAQAHAPAGTALARRARTRRGPWAARSGPSTPTAPRSSAAPTCCSSPPTSGVDVVCAAEDAERVRGALDVPVVPEAAAEVLRVESGRPRYGLDLDEGTIPQEAGLNERAVSFTKGCYVGQETVARLHYRGKPNRHLRGLRFSDAGGHGHAAGARRARGRARSARASSRRAWVRSGWRWCGARRRWATSSSRARRARSSLSCRSRRSRLRLRRRAALTASPRGGVPPLAAVRGASRSSAGAAMGVRSRVFHDSLETLALERRA